MAGHPLAAAVAGLQGLRAFAGNTDWRLLVSLVVLPLALYSQMRTRRLNVPALLLSPLVYGVLAVLTEVRLSSTGVGLGPAVLLLAFGAALGYAQGRSTAVFYDEGASDYRQRGGPWPLAFWAAALLLRQVAARWLAAGLPPGDGRLGASLSIDAVLLGLLAGRALALVRRYPALWRAGAAQLRGDAVTPPSVVDCTSAERSSEAGA